jgi:hypothetical protein
MTRISFDATTALARVTISLHPPPKEWPKVRLLKSINFAYMAEEDRVLAAINPGDAEAWSCWLTRRLVLALLERATEFLTSTSALIRQAPADVRGEFVTFEREAAIVMTATAMSKTPADVLKMSATAAELAEQLTISSRAGHFRVELRGGSGGGAAGLLTRAELQRFLQMLQTEVARGGWLDIPVKSSAAPITGETNQKPVRH